MYSFSTSFCTVPESLPDVRALPPRHRHIQRQQNRPRRIDGHRCRNPRQINAREQPLHVFDRINRHPHLAHFPRRQRVVRIHSDLRRQIERHRKPRRPIRQQILVALVRLLGIAHARILPHGPQPPAVHRGLHPARERILPRIPNLTLVIRTFKIRRRIQRLHRNVRRSLPIRRSLDSVRHAKTLSRSSSHSPARTILKKSSCNSEARKPLSFRSAQRRGTCCRRQRHRSRPPSPPRLYPSASPSRTNSPQTTQTSM